MNTTVSNLVRSLDDEVANIAWELLKRHVYDAGALFGSGMATVTSRRRVTSDKHTFFKIPNARIIALGILSSPIAKLMRDLAVCAP